MQNHSISAEPIGIDHFLARFCLSGGIVEFVRDDGGEPEIYCSRVEALAVAGFYCSARLRGRNDAHEGW